MDLVQLLKPWISTFSVEIMKKFAHGEEVVVGGKILQIFKASDLCSESQVSVYVTVDDALGVTDLLFLEPAAYDTYDAIYHFRPGMVVLAKGLVYKQEGKRHPEDKVDSSVVCYEICSLESK